MSTRLAACCATTVHGVLALIGEAGLQDSRDVACGSARVVTIIAVAFASQKHMPRVVKIIVPLRAIFAVGWIGQWVEQIRFIVVVLQHQVDRASLLCRKTSRGL